MMEIITSIKHPAVIEARSLLSAAKRKLAEKILLEDEEIICWALKAGLEINHVFALENKQSDPFMKFLQQKGIKCFAVSSGILKKINGRKYTVPWIGVADLAGQRRIQKDLLFELLQRIQHNCTKMLQQDGE